MTARGGRSTAIGTAALAAIFAALAFAGKGGTDVSRLAEVEIWLVLLATGVIGGAALGARTHSPAGVVPVLAFAALAAFTALSISWSLAPDESWIEANRTLAYLFAFTAAVVAGNVVPRSPQVVLGAIALGATAIVAYGLAARVWLGALAELEFYARLGQPFGYWNALGVTAAMGLVGVVWFGSRREVPVRAVAAAAPAAAWLFTALLLTYSRSGLLAAAIAVGLWLIFVPLRLRTLTVLAAAAAGAAPAIGWALSQPAFTEDGVELATREDAGTTFGLLLLLATAISYALCFGALRWRERNEPGPETRRRAGLAAVAVAALLVVLGFGALATTERGLGGTIADRVEELTDDSAQTSAGPGRLGTTASSRSSYWRSAGQVFADHPVAGAGAGAFAVAGLRYRESAHVSRHAHGYAVQTLADLGLIGLALSLLLAAAWAAAALRAVGPRRSGPARDGSGERVALMALALAALAYGMQSTFDWTWFVPGPTVMALVAAGFVAGCSGAGAPPEAAATERAGRAWRVGLAALAAVLALATAWSAWQPHRALEVGNDALTLAADGQPETALSRAADARDANPLSARPLWAEAAALIAAGRVDEAHAVLERAALEHPNLAQAWLRLADFRLDRLNRPEEALEAVEVALYLDPHSAAVQQSFIDIRDRFRSEGALPPETAPPVEGP